MFEEIIASKELKFNDLEKKYIDCFIGCLIIKLIFSIKIDFGHESVEMLEQSYMLGKECSRWQKIRYMMKILKR